MRFAEWGKGGKRLTGRGLGSPLPGMSMCLPGMSVCLAILPVPEKIQSKISLFIKAVPWNRLSENAAALCEVLAHTTSTHIPFP